MNYSGLAKIIPFMPRAQVRVGPPWSTAELGELFRVAHVLRQSGMAIETDMGLSDEGDPWFVFYSTQTEDVIAHFARLNGEIVVHGLSASGVVSGVDLNDVVRRLVPVQAMEAQQRVRKEGSVVFHPFMILVAFVAASFLATEESQASSPPSQNHSAPSADRAVDAAKIKTDWLDRAMTLLQSKSKDRGESLSADTASGRKFTPQDTTQHSMALVMLAAAISQAKTDIAELGGDLIDSSPDTKHVPVINKLVADPVTPQNDVLSDLDATIPTAIKAQAASDAHVFDQDGQNYLSNFAAISVVSGADEGNFIPSVAHTSAQAAMPNATPQGTSAAQTVFAPDPEPLNLPETVPSVSVLLPVGGSGSLIGKAVVSTLTVGLSAPSGLASFDVLLDGGTLQFHQSLNLIDVRTFELNGPQAPSGQTPDSVKEGHNIDSLSLLVMAQSGTMVSLTDARESVLIGAGDIRIRNFTFGVDQLVLQNSEIMAKAPEVLFSYTGDVIIKFNESTKVTLLGVFAPGELISSFASISAL